MPPKRTVSAPWWLLHVDWDPRAEVPPGYRTFSGADLWWEGGGMSWAFQGTEDSEWPTKFLFSFLPIRASLRSEKTGEISIFIEDLSSNLVLFGIPNHYINRFPRASPLIPDPIPGRSPPRSQESVDKARPWVLVTGEPWLNQIMGGGGLPRINLELSDKSISDEIWFKITRGFIPSVSEFHWDLSANSPLMSAFFFLFYEFSNLPPPPSSANGKVIVLSKCVASSINISLASSRPASCPWEPILL